MKASPVEAFLAFAHRKPTFPPNSSKRILSFHQTSKSLKEKPKESIDKNLVYTKTLNSVHSAQNEN